MSADHIRMRFASTRPNVEPGKFHETFANEPTVTYMTKTAELPDHQPRVLCRIGQQPDNSFNRYAALTEGQLWGIVQEAFGT